MSNTFIKYLEAIIIAYEAKTDYYHALKGITSSIEIDEVIDLCHSMRREVETILNKCVQKTAVHDYDNSYAYGNSTYVMYCGKLCIAYGLNNPPIAVPEE